MKKQRMKPWVGWAVVGRDGRVVVLRPVGAPPFTLISTTKRDAKGNLLFKSERIVRIRIEQED